MRVHRWGLAGVVASALLVAPDPASAQQARRIHVEVMVCSLSDRAGVIDGRASRLHRALRNQFRYESLRMLHRERLALDLGAVGTVKLPNGHWIRARPLHVGHQGVLIAVEVEGVLKTDFRVPNGQLVVIGAEPYRQGRLIISLEPQF